MPHRLRCRAMPRHKTGFRSALCVVLSAAALLAASPGARHVRADDATALKVYFGKQGGLGGRDAACSQVAAVARQVPSTQGVARAALQELFRGPTPEEREAGYRSWFSGSTGAILKDVRIADRGRGPSLLFEHERRVYGGRGQRTL